MVSDKTQELIDSKVSTILKNALAKAKEIITKNKDLHDRIARALLEKEEMTEEEFDAFFEGVA